MVPRFDLAQATELGAPRRRTLRPLELVTARPDHVDRAGIIAACRYGILRAVIGRSLGQSRSTGL